MAVSFELFVEFDSSIPGEERREQRDLLRLACPAFGFVLVNWRQLIAN
jgi:hypothetical protein